MDNAALRDHFGPDPSLFDEEETDHLYEGENEMKPSPKFYELEDHRTGEKWVVKSRDLDHTIAYGAHKDISFEGVPEDEVAQNALGGYYRRSKEELLKQDLITAMRHWRSWSVSEYSSDPRFHSPEFITIMERHGLLQDLLPEKEQS